ncbi:hypothetical protein N2152v2_004678 [Parachlorella kessleri]
MAAVTNGKRRDRDSALTWSLPPALEDGTEPQQGQGVGPAAASRAAFAHVAEAHLGALVQQQLQLEGIASPERWGSVVVKLAQQAAASLSPTALTAEGNMDPRVHIKVKRVVGGGEPAASSVVQGVVFRKNVSHKRMRTNISQANVMLLAGALEWQPTESKLQQFDALLNEEQAYLQSAVKRIVSFSPDVLLVERSVARYAQELLLEHDVALVLNVKRELMDRIARCTDAEVVPSLAQLNSHSLGFCKEFDVESLLPPGQPGSLSGPQLAKVSMSRTGQLNSSVPGSPSAAAAAAAQEQGHLIADAAALRRQPQPRSGPNSLMLFKGCPRPLGCSIVLRGGDASVLAKVKRVVAFASYAAYWNRLEADLMADQLASAAAAAAAIPRPLSPTTAPAALQQPLTAASGPSGAIAAVDAPHLVSPGAQEEAAATGATEALEGGKEEQNRGTSAFWEALAAACAEASARDAAEQRGRELIVSPSPHVNFVGSHGQECSLWSAGEEGDSDEAEDYVARARGQSSADSTTGASAASSPTKSRTASAGVSAQEHSPPAGAAASNTLATGLTGSDEAAMRALMLTDDSSASDPWVVPAEAFGATVTITGHAPAANSLAALSQPGATTATREASWGMSAGLQEGEEGEEQQVMSPQDPLSRAAREHARRLAAEEAGHSSADDEGGATSSPGPQQEQQPPSLRPSTSQLSIASGATAGQSAAEPMDVPQLARVSTRSGVATGESSPKAFDPAVASGAEVRKGAGEASSPALTIYASQQLWVSISCKNPAKGILCEPPHTHCMHFYAKEDMPLAHFLAAATPTNRKCAHPACGEGAMLHLRSFMHGDGLVTLSSVRLPAGQELPGREKGQIWMWLRPLGKDSEAQRDVRRVALSAEAACMSFAHLLNLLLDARHLTLGGQSLQRDYVRYLGSGSTVLCLHHSHVTPYDVQLPLTAVELSAGAQAAWLVEEAKGLTEEADEAFGAIQYALGQQLQPLVEEDPEFVQGWLANLDETRAAFMSMVHSARAGLAPHQLGDGEQQDHQGLAAPQASSPKAQHLATVVWELNRLRRLLACEVLQWATALHEGTPVARAAPPQAVVGSVAGSLGRHSRHGSMDADTAARVGAALGGGGEPPQQQQVVGASAVGSMEASGLVKAAAHAAPPAGTAVLPPDTLSGAGEGMPAAGDAAHTTSAALQPTATAALPKPLKRVASSHLRRSSVSLGQHMKATMSQFTASQPSPAAYAPSLRDGPAEGATAGPDAAPSMASEQQQPPIPIGLVARYVSLFDDRASRRSRDGGASYEQRVEPASQAAQQQRTFDWVQRASPSFAMDSGSSGPPQTAAQALAGMSAGGGSTLGPAADVRAVVAADSQQSRQLGAAVPAAAVPAEPASFYVSMSDEEEEEEVDEVDELSEHPSSFADVAAVGGSAQTAIERLRRPSMRIDLANPDPELFGPAREAAEEEEGEETPQSPLKSAFERLASRFGRLSLRRSLSDRRRRHEGLSSLAPRTVGFTPSPAGDQGTPGGDVSPSALSRQGDSAILPAELTSAVPAAAEPATQAEAAAEVERETHEPSRVSSDSLGLATASLSGLVEEQAWDLPSEPPSTAAIAEPLAPALVAQGPPGAPSETAAGPGAEQAVALVGMPEHVGSLEVPSSAPSVSHFEEWAALLQEPGGEPAPAATADASAPGARGTTVEGTLALAQEPPAATVAPGPPAPEPASAVSSVPLAAKLPPLPPPSAALKPPLPATAAASVQQAEPTAPLAKHALGMPSVGPGTSTTSTAAAPAHLPTQQPAEQLPAPQKQPSKLKQLLGRLRLDGPGAQQAGGAGTPGAAAAGKVELSGRSLLPPGLEGMHVTIFDEEPTSIIAYFLSTRVYQQYLRDAESTIISGANSSTAQRVVPASGAADLAESSISVASSGPQSTASTQPAAEPGAAATPQEALPQHHPQLQRQPPGGGAAAMAGTATAAQPPTQASTQPSQQQQQQPQQESQGGEGPRAAADRGGSEWRVLFSEQRLDCQLSIEDMSPGMPWGRAKFQVVAYYAPQFAELRRRCVAGGEAAYLASLSRCRKWASRGGKSNVYFAKTRDDRYIVKQLSKSERQSFLEFAPDYFRYVATMLHRGQDTCLAKILGVYQVSVRYANSSSGSTMPFGGAAGGGGGGGRDGSSVVDLLVMENIFYGRSITRIYDLKGSERDRYVAENPAVAGAVLLDENLREVNLVSPTLVAPQAFARLQRALWSDTAFLSGLGVMDYSLLVGFDKQGQELVVGVIDFIRQYTWDKQVETWVKKSGILGGSGKDPTVISPKQYSRRFRVAISGYITVVPSLAPPPPLLDPDAL